MLEFRRGDILEAGTEAVVNTVNCVGVMGRGIALQFKKAYPENFREYAQACEKGEVRPGTLFIHRTGDMLGPAYIINFPTKRHWRGRSRMEDIEAGLSALVAFIQDSSITSIALPPLGSGLGGLEWTDVRRRIVAAMEVLTDVHIVIYEPGGGPSGRVATTPVPRMTPGRAALIGLTRKYLEGLLDPWVTLVEVHKLMYFMQEAGEPLRVRFRKAAYGPYGENIRHVLHAVEGHYLEGYRDGGDDPEKRLSLVTGAVEDAQKVLAEKDETRARLDRVGSLVDGFESPTGLELLATVHWLLTHEGIRGRTSLVEGVIEWSPGKRKFTERQILIAEQVLKDRGWVPSEAPEEGRPL